MSTPLSESLEQAKHLLERGSVHASKIGREQGKIQNKASFKPEHILCFFFHADVKMYKTSTKHLLIRKRPLKKVLSLIIEFRMFLKFFQKLWCLGSLGPKQATSAPMWRNKVEILDGQFRNEKLSFVYKKETEYSFKLSLYFCVFCRCIFNLEMQNFGLKNHSMVSASHFVENVCPSQKKGVRSVSSSIPWKPPKIIMLTRQILIGQ